MEALCWLVVASKISTVDNLRRKGSLSDNLNDLCSLCGKVIESINQAFIHCEFHLLFDNICLQGVAFVGTFHVF